MIRPEPSSENLAWLQGSPTRWELLQLAQIVLQLNTSQMELLGAFLDNDLDAARTVAPAILEQGRALGAMLRELLNAGVDPEWDYRA